MEINFFSWKLFFFYKFKWVCSECANSSMQKPWGPFLESPGSLSGPVSRSILCPASTHGCATLSVAYVC